MIMPVTMLRTHLLIAAIAAALVLAVITACGGDDDTSGSASPSGSGAPSGSGGATITTAPTPGGDPLIPPLEGPAPGPLVTEMTDWRQDPDWALPRPEDAVPADDPDNPILNPPASPDCPAEWVKIDRPAEGYQICYPVTWVVGTHGYVSSANESRWYALGLYDFSDPENQIQRAHVSIYMFPTFARPVRYTIDCPDLRGVTLSGLPAVVCPDFPGLDPEAEIISYQASRGDRDYFLNIVTYKTYDPEAAEYTDEVDQDARDLAIEVARTFKFIAIAEPAPTETPAETPTP